MYLVSSLFTWQTLAYEACREFTEQVISQWQRVIEILYQSLII